MNEIPVLEVRSLFKYFPVKQSLLRRVDKSVKAVDDVSFTLGRGEVLAIVGESGCGKTTIARTLIGLEEQTDGEILFHGEIVGVHERRSRTGLAPVGSTKEEGMRSQLTLPHIALKRLRQRVQMIFQDPYESLNPRSTIFEIVAEPLVVHKIARGHDERNSRVKTARLAQIHDEQFAPRFQNAERFI